MLVVRVVRARLAVLGKLHTWYYMGLHGTIYMVLYVHGITWEYMGLHEITWYYMYMGF